MKNTYYWLDTDYIYGDESKKLAIWSGEIIDGEKDRSKERVLMWARWEDVPGCEGDDVDWDALDAYIEAELGFLPEYEVN